MSKASAVEAILNAYSFGKSARSQYEDGFGTFSLEDITLALQGSMQMTRGEKQLITRAMYGVSRYLAASGSELNGESLAKIKWSDLEQRRVGVASLAFLKGLLEP